MMAHLISSTKAKKLVEKGATLVDLRSPVDFAVSSLPHAVNITLRNVSRMMMLNKKTPLVFFGASDDDADIKQAENYAIQMGFEKVFLLGSIKNWE